MRVDFFDPATECIFMKRKGFINNFLVRSRWVDDMRTGKQGYKVRVKAEIVEIVSCVLRFALLC